MPGSWYEKYVCTALARGIVTGYPDQSFRPEQPVTFAEAAAILARAFLLPLSSGDADVWFRAPVEALAARSAIPVDVTGFDVALNRGILGEMVYRLTATIPAQPSLTFAALEGSTVHAAAGQSLQEETLTIINAIRSERGLSPLTHNAVLEEAARRHAEDMQTLQYLAHASRDGRTPEDRIREAGYLSIDLATCGCKRWTYRWGEVINDFGRTPREVMDAFMSSPVHSSILTSPVFNEAGVGKAGEYWVIDLGIIHFIR